MNLVAAYTTLGCLILCYCLSSFAGYTMKDGRFTPMTWAFVLMMIVSVVATIIVLGIVFILELV